MRHSLERIMAKPSDYKICVNEGDVGCGALHWYEVDECPNCGGEEFQAASQNNVDEYCADFAEAYPASMDEAEIFIDFG